MDLAVSAARKHFRQVPGNRLHRAFRNAGFGHLGDALVPEIMKSESEERLRSVPARRFRVSASLDGCPRCLISSALRRGLHERPPRGTERLLVTLKIKLIVLARREYEMLWEASAHQFSPLSKPGERGHGVIVQGNQPMPGLCLAPLH